MHHYLNILILVVPLALACVFMAALKPPRQKEIPVTEDEIKGLAKSADDAIEALMADPKNTTLLEAAKVALDAYQNALRQAFDSMTEQTT